MFEPNLKVICFNAASKGCCKYKEEINVSFYKGDRRGKKVFPLQECLTGVCQDTLRCVGPPNVHTKRPSILRAHQLDHSSTRPGGWHVYFCILINLTSFIFSSCFISLYFCQSFMNYLGTVFQKGSLSIKGGEFMTQYVT